MQNKNASASGAFLFLYQSYRLRHVNHAKIYSTKHVMLPLRTVRKTPPIANGGVLVARGRGFEPRLKDSESFVLPLDDPRMALLCGAKIPKKR